ncbi:MAG: hypothetical protein IJD04_03295 [Desulfovibrionaceae bacterium]|nr:hypothetical protein [Desulfovibrionaceae bacterium]
MLTFSLLLAGCGDEAANYYGAWKSVKSNSFTKKPDVYILTENSVTVNDSDNPVAVRYEKRGEEMVVIVNATDQPMLIITPIDENKIKLDSGFFSVANNGEYVRTTEEDAKAIIDMKVERRKPNDDGF